jgi:hypothetical protein
LSTVANIDVGPEVAGAYGRCFDEYSALLQKAAARVTAAGTSVISSSTGVPYDAALLQDIMLAVDYKIRYSAVSLSRLQETKAEQLAGISHGALKDVTEDAAFHIEIVLSFISSAWDMASQVVHMVHGTTLSQNRIYLFNVAQNLAARSGAQYDLFRTLYNSASTGWISKFEDYRNFVNHASRIHIGTTFRWSVSAGLNISPILLPDHPVAFPPIFSNAIDAIYYGREALVMALGFITALYQFSGQFV